MFKYLFYKVFIWNITYYIKLKHSYVHSRSLKGLIILHKLWAFIIIVLLGGITLWMSHHPAISVPALNHSLTSDSILGVDVKTTNLWEVCGSKWVLGNSLHCSPEGTLEELCYITMATQSLFNPPLISLQLSSFRVTWKTKDVKMLSTT